MTSDEAADPVPIISPTPTPVVESNSSRARAGWLLAAAVVGAALVMLLIISRSTVLKAITVTATAAAVEPVDRQLDPKKVAQSSVARAKDVVDRAGDAIRDRAAGEADRARQLLARQADRFRKSRDETNDDLNLTDSLELDVASDNPDETTPKPDETTPSDPVAPVSSEEATLEQVGDELPVIEGEARPDYELQLSTGRKFLGMRNIRTLGIRDNRSARDGLTWTIEPPVSVSEVGLVILRDHNDLLPDKRIAELSLADFDTLHDGYQFESETQFDLLFGVQSFFTGLAGFVSLLFFVPIVIAFLSIVSG